MKIGKLVEELSKFPEDLDVNLFDWKQNMFDDSGDGSSSGIYPEFQIGLIGDEYLQEDQEDWIAISFDSDDYDNDAMPHWHDEMEELKETRLTVDQCAERLKQTLTKMSINFESEEDRNDFILDVVKVFKEVGLEEE